MGQLETIRLSIDPRRPAPEAIAHAAQVIRDGGLVAFPTETVYGLGAEALNPVAVDRIFRAKGRPADNPLIVHVAGVQALRELTSEVPGVALTLGSRFWPGPLTLVLMRSGNVPDITTGGLETVAVRVPAHPVALALLEASERPIAAPSANRSGQPSPTDAHHVLEDLGGRVEMVLDAGATPIGLESTVLDVTQDPPLLLRPGGVPKEDLEEVVGEVRSLQGQTNAAKRSPGTRYRHYAPRATVLLAPVGEAEALAACVLEEGKTVGIMSRSLVHSRHTRLRVRGMPLEPASYAREMFAALRELDSQGCQVIVAESVEEEGLGLAVMDRLRRAAAANDKTETGQASP